VSEHLPSVAERTGCPPKFAVEVFDAVHTPLIRFVDLPAACSDGRVAAVAARDPEDAPLAHLAALLAPAVVLTRDKHLTAMGIGQPDWLNTLLVLRELVSLEFALWGGSRAALLSIYLPALALRALGRQVVRSDIALGAAIGSAVGAAVFLRPQLRLGAADAWSRVAPALERLAELVGDVFERYVRAQGSLESRLVLPADPPVAEAVAARLLAEHWEPLKSERIHGELVSAGFSMSLSTMRAKLQRHPAFVGLPGRGVQLGRRLAARHHIADALPVLADLSSERQR